MFIFFSAISCFLSILLYAEYRFFVKQADKMVELKQEYQSYIVALKKVLHDYNTLVAQENDDLGKLASERYSQLAVRAARAVERSQKNQSSDQTESKDTNFVVVNREISYLKQSMIDYLKAEKLDNLLNHLDLDECVTIQTKLLMQVNQNHLNENENLLQSGRVQLFHQAV